MWLRYWRLKMTNDELDRMKALLSYDHREAFVLKMIEELNELALSVIHYEAGKEDFDNLAKEVADVLFQIDKMFYLYKDGNLKEQSMIHLKGIRNHVDKLTGRLLDV